jgi:hypothetical protein
MTGTGQYQYACRGGGQIYTSTDYGNIWSVTSAPSLGWRCIAISSSGQYITAGTDSTLYYSNDSGTTWTNATQTACINIAMSGSGQYQLYADGDFTTSSLRYSSNYGQTWANSSSIIAIWRGIAMSSSGQYSIAGTSTNGSQIYSSYLPTVFASNIITYGTVTAAAFVATSDYRIKQNIMMIEDTVDDLRPLQYYNIITQKTDFGFLAHEVQELFPFLVEGEKDGSTNQSLNYLGLIALLVKEIQDIKKKNNTLEKKVELLENKF